MPSTAWDNRIVEYDPAVPLDQLLAHPRNPKIHPTAQTDALKGILGDVGWLTGLIVNTRTGHMLDGHDRVKAAMQAGQTTAPVFYVSVPEDQEPYILATFDPVGTLAGTDSAVLTDLLREVSSADSAVQALLASLVTEPEVLPTPGAGGDEFDATPQPGETRVQPGDLWALGPHRLLCGDSTDPATVDRLFGTARFEMVWTDPPYGVAIGDKNKYLKSIARSNRVEEHLQNDTLDEPALLTMLQEVFALAVGKGTAGGAWYVAAPAGPLHVLFGQALKDLGIWRQTIQWVKNNATFAPLGVDYHWRAEPIFYGWQPGAAHRYYGGRKQDTVWEIDRPQASPDHPTMKPLELVQRALENSSQSGEVVYDPFLGSGTTLIAAHRTGRVAYGLEIEPRYCDVVLRRAEAEGIGPIERIAP